MLILRAHSNPQFLLGINKELGGSVQRTKDRLWYARLNFPPSSGFLLFLSNVDSYPFFFFFFPRLSRESRRYFGMKLKLLQGSFRLSCYKTSCCTDICAAEFLSEPSSSSAMTRMALCDQFGSPTGFFKGSRWQTNYPQTFLTCLPMGWSHMHA